MTNTTQRANEWIAGRDTGVSSKVIWSVMQMTRPADTGTPWDADDFGRCYRLLKLIPEWREHLALVSQTYPAWVGLVREWDRLTALYEQVIGPTGKGWDKKASRAFNEAIDPLIDEGRIADGWVKTGPGSWKKDGGGSIVKLGGKLSGFTMSVGS